ncbi:MAG: O-acetylhomoserine aminocarboxypropyltransferase/cysteine synthase [Spirochaetes bacterium]|uniref:O-acetylhomoserine aminocarboxypropyltransferase/cysteine synthase n=1 Tax=Candidatus Ornithospirochaeta stercoripullorum TaxID=2840899 RepID=A0A9D9E2F7_9SPIO|nr:O-acetylhomoserine aminocarboxypropyltransferase/cysteine synthase [Candidatus Ornithospirochaeta stercoripullorum]
MDRATICVQGGYEPKNGEPRVLPIYQSTTYKYDSAAELAKLFDLESPGHMYTRISNPTVDSVEKKVAELEGGVGAMMTSSGQAASLISVFNIASAGDNFIMMGNLYGGTTNLFLVTMKRMGIEARVVNPEMSDEEILSLFDDRTRLFFGETIANPSLAVFDFDRFVPLAHSKGVPLIIDNTFATPILCRPFEHGADIVIHSSTKYMDGHAVVVGGMIVDGGTFDWTKGGKYPELTEPDESYHGVVYTESFGKSAYITKARVQLMRDLGSTPQPIAAFLLNLGLETLSLRIRKHSENALAVAKYLETRSDVIESVSYPGLESSPEHARAMKYLDDGLSSGVVSFSMKGGREKAMKFMDSLHLASIVVHVADARTCVLNPASTTHRQLSDEMLKEAGIDPGFVRFSVGIEDVKDIISDIEGALACL